MGNPQNIFLNALEAMASGLIVMKRPESILLMIGW